MDWSKANCLFDPKGLQVATLSCLSVAFGNFVTAAFTLSGVVAVVIIIMSGIKLIFSSGDTKKMEEARKVLTYAIGGLLLILFSVAIVNVISFVTGVNCIAAFNIGDCKK